MDIYIYQLRIEPNGQKYTIKGGILTFNQKAAYPREKIDWPLQSTLTTLSLTCYLVCIFLSKLLEKLPHVSDVIIFPKMLPFFLKFKKKFINIGFPRGWARFVAVLEGEKRATDRGLYIHLASFPPEKKQP